MDVVFKTNTPDPRKAFLDLTPQECANCRRFWLRFRILERVQTGSLLILLALPWFSHSFAVKVPASIRVTLLVAMLASHVWLYAL